MTILSSILREDGGVPVLCSAFQRHAAIDSNNNGGGTNSDHAVVNTQQQQQPVLQSILPSSSASTNVAANNITSKDLNSSSSSRRQQLSSASDVLSRSQARRMKLQQSYNEITSRIAKVEEGATVTIGNNSKGNSGRHVQQQQQQQQQQIGEEGRDDDNAVVAGNIKSPRVQQLFNFDDVREENNHHHDDNVQDTEKVATTTTTAASKAYHNLPPFGSNISHRNKNNDDNNNNNRQQQWNNSQLRREHRISIQKSTQIDIAEIEQFTKEMRLKIQLYGAASSSPKKESGVVMSSKMAGDVTVNAANEKNEEVGAGRLKSSSTAVAGGGKKYKRQSYASIKQQINQLHSKEGAVGDIVATRWRAIKTPNGNYSDDENDETTARDDDKIKTRIGGNDDEKKGQQHHQQQYLSEEDRLEAWWKERQRNAARRSGSTTQHMSGERFDNWWQGQREIRKKYMATTSFSELEGEPTLEDDDVKKKKMNPTAPSSKAVDDTIKEVEAFVRQVKATENSPSLKNKSTEKQQQQQQQQQQQVAADRSSCVVGSSNDSPGPASPEVGMSNPHAEPSSSPVVAALVVSNEEDTTQNKPSLVTHSPATPAVVEKSATSGALNLILSRIDEAKVQFAKALEEGDVKKQADFAALLARLGEAAVALKKLDQL